jgi:voltage-gated potassium channel
MANTQTLRRVIQERKHTVLLAGLIFMSLAQPLAHGILVGLVLYDVVLTCVLLGVFIVVFERTHERFLSVALALPAVVLRWVSYGLAEPYHFYVTATHQALLVAFFGLAVGVILRGIFEQKTIKSDHVIGTVCGYLLAGAAWGSGYSLCEQLLPDSFDVNPQISWQLKDEHSRAFLFNYFSLCTLTGASYGDITPIRPAVASLTWLEAMFGQFYLAVVVAQLVGLKMAQAIDGGKGEVNSE